MIGPRVFRLAALIAGTAGGLSGAAYGLLNRQSEYAKHLIGDPGSGPIRADGIYLPDGGGPFSRADLPAGSEPAGSEPASSDSIEFVVIGDSTAAGLGVDFPHELPGVLLARGLAAELHRPVALTTYAKVGITTLRLAVQIDAALAKSPRVALVLIGANDVSARLSVRGSAELLGSAVSRLTADGVAVVAGTCPDLGAVRPIPQPLRAIARSWSLRLGRAQRRAIEAAGGEAVPLADLLSPEFLARPTEFFSTDQFHPSAAGYQAAATILLPALCSSLGTWQGPPPPAAPTRSTAAEARRPTNRIVARLNRGLWRKTRP